MVFHPILSALGNHPTSLPNPHSETVSTPSLCLSKYVFHTSTPHRDARDARASEAGTLWKWRIHGDTPKKWYQFSRLFTKDIPDIPKYRSSVWINPTGTALAPSSTQALPVRVKGSQTPTDRKRSPTHKDKAVISYSSSEQDMRVSKNGVVKYNLNRKILHRPLDVLFVSLWMFRQTHMVCTCLHYLEADGWSALGTQTANGTD